MTLPFVLRKLQKLANPEKVAFKKKKFGVLAQNSLGVYHSDLKTLARDIGTDNTLAVQLFNSKFTKPAYYAVKYSIPKILLTN